jgi:hypothetical protein
MVSRDRGLVYKIDATTFVIIPNSQYPIPNENKKFLNLKIQTFHWKLVIGYWELFNI